ncbi:Tify domain [Dillenia turbinata]|uniref:Protein TIFY n=1 Tax=Dillenia turbinata TaxID=194707 RepID=A0AAN8Z070_9MAGN
MKIETCSSDEHSCLEISNKHNIGTASSSLTTHLEKENGKGQAKMSQSIGLFRKYLFTKTQPHHYVGKTNVEESEAINKSAARPLSPPKFGSNMPRRPSFLKQQLLPQFRYYLISSHPISSGHGLCMLAMALFGTIFFRLKSYDVIHHNQYWLVRNPQTAQLTIFYSGTVNVYDDVPLDKKEGDVKSPIHRPHLPSVGNLQAGFPLTRKESISRFLEKRRSRIHKSPYLPSAAEHEEMETTWKDDLNGPNKCISSSIPSCLGYILPTSTDED